MLYFSVQQTKLTWKGNSFIQKFHWIFQQGDYSQSVFTCSKSWMETLEDCRKSVQSSMFNKDTRMTSRTILSIFNRFHSLFYCFVNWLWASKYRLVWVLLPLDYDTDLSQRPSYHFVDSLQRDIWPWRQGCYFLREEQIRQKKDIKAQK